MIWQLSALWLNIFQPKIGRRKAASFFLLNMLSIIRYLRSESFIFTAILCVLFSQILHTAYLFNEVSRLDLFFQIGTYQFRGLSWLHAIICALAIEGAILMFIINGKKKAAQIYAFASFISNLLYYQHWHGSIEQLIASTLISAMLSGSIWYFSDLFVEKIAIQEKLAEAITQDMSENVSIPKLFTCEECGHSYETEQQLRGHLSGHARRAKKMADVPMHTKPSKELNEIKVSSAEEVVG
jgi:hypothetical protein